MTARTEGFSLHDATVSAGGRTLLHPLSLDLPPDRVVGLIGHNGSGKSTLLKALARQRPVSGGRVAFAGQDVTAWSDRAFSRHVAYLAQDLPPANGLRVRDLVALGRYPWHGALGRFGAGDRAKVEEALALTDVAGLADRQLDTLSGGERQRAWLAMLVAQDARCLLLDEPISALDVAHQIGVMRLITRLSREHDLGVLVVLHDINIAARFCDDILALRDGRLIAHGPAADLMTHDALEDIYGIPMEVIASGDRPHAVAFPK